jgi:hypothetical protein
LAPSADTTIPQMVPMQQRMAIVQKSIFRIVKIDPLRPQLGEEGQSTSSVGR